MIYTNILLGDFAGKGIQYREVMMSTMPSQITNISIVCSTVYSGTNQRKHQSLASLAFARGIHRSTVDCSHNGPVTRKMFPLDDVIMYHHESTNTTVTIFFRYAVRPKNCTHNLHIPVFCDGIVAVYCTHSRLFHHRRDNHYYDCPASSEAIPKNMGNWAPLILEAVTKLPPFCKRHFQTHVVL